MTAKFSAYTFFVIEKFNCSMNLVCPDAKLFYGNPMEKSDEKLLMNKFHFKTYIFNDLYENMDILIVYIWKNLNLEFSQKIKKMSTQSDLNHQPLNL